MGIAGLMTGAGAAQGLEALIRQRLAEREMKNREVQVQQAGELANRRMAADEEQNAWERQRNLGLDAERSALAQERSRLADQTAGEDFSKKVVESTSVGGSFSPKMAGVLKAYGQGGVVRNAVQGTQSDPETGTEVPAEQYFRGYTAPEAEKFNAGEMASQDRKDAATQRTTDQENLVKLTASLRPPAQGGASLTPGGLDVAATQYATTGSMPPLGMGSADMRSAIINRAAELFPDLNVASEAAGYSANKGSLVQLTKRYNATKAYAEQAKLSLQNAGQLAPSVAQSGTPLVNKYKNWANKTLRGSAPLSRFEVFVYTAARDYARVTSGGAESVAQMTDAANEAAESLLNSAMTPDAFSAALEAMQIDMDNAMGTLGDQIATVRGQAGRRPNTDPSAPQTPRDAAPVKKRMKFVNGQLVEVK
jgi:hypothetical protein